MVSGSIGLDAEHPCGMYAVYEPLTPSSLSCISGLGCSLTLVLVGTPYPAGMFAALTAYRFLLGIGIG